MSETPKCKDKIYEGKTSELDPYADLLDYGLGKSNKRAASVRIVLQDLHDELDSIPLGSPKYIRKLTDIKIATMHLQNVLNAEEKVHK